MSEELKKLRLETEVGVWGVQARMTSYDERELKILLRAFKKVNKSLAARPMTRRKLTPATL